LAFRRGHDHDRSGLGEQRDGRFEGLGGGHGGGIEQGNQRRGLLKEPMGLGGRCGDRAGTRLAAKGQLGPVLGGQAGIGADNLYFLRWL